MSSGQTRKVLLVLAAFVAAAAVATPEAEPGPRGRGRGGGGQRIAEKEGRKERLLSLFSIIQFKQDACTTASDATMMGTCMTETECSDKSGSADGNCAAGFGVCCMFTAVCGTTTTVSQNCTYLQNAQYPSSASASTTCSYTFSRICDNLCQIRLDFDNLVTAAPPTSGTTLGSCTTATDNFQLTSPTGGTLPAVCGTLTGQHMYMETGASGSAGTAVVTFGTGTATTRTFKIKATYYQCNSVNRAPPGCLQYFTGPSGTIKSYNHDGGAMLISQSYNNCIRQEQGFCTISWTSSPGTSPNPFSLPAFNPAQAPASPAVTEASSCVLAYVQIPSTQFPSGMGNRVCGNIFSSNDDTTVPGTIVGDAANPFQVTTFSTTDIGAAASTGVTGYSLDYSQVPC